MAKSFSFWFKEMAPVHLDKGSTNELLSHVRATHPVLANCGCMLTIVTAAMSNIV